MNGCFYLIFPVLLPIIFGIIIKKLPMERKMRAIFSVGGLFLLSLLLSPLFLAIPAFATAPALIIVGFYMLTTITRIDFDNLYDAIPAYITIIAMPFAYSISEGICFGIISWTILNLCSKNWRKVSPLMIVLTILFLLKYAFL